MDELGAVRLCYVMSGHVIAMDTFVAWMGRAPRSIRDCMASGPTMFPQRVSEANGAPISSTPQLMTVST